MFVVFLSRPARVYGVWSGRRTLAVLDAVAWPAAWAWLLATKVPNGGLTVRWLLALLGCIAVRRVWRAMVDNEYYGFSTWRWGKVLLWAWGFGLLLKWSLMH